MNTKHPVFEGQNHVDHHKHSEEVQSSSSHLVESEKTYQSAKKMTIISKVIGYIGILFGAVSLFFIRIYWV